MNEFIVWDKRKNCFNDELLLDKDGHCFGLSGIDNDIVYLRLEDYTIHRYIGIEDINNNKIYADSSIIEFEHLKKQIKGYFWFDKYELRYKIVIDISLSFGGITKLTTVEYNQDIKNIKIIDTIQQKKLGLIK